MSKPTDTLSFDDAPDSIEPLSLAELDDLTSDAYACQRYDADEDARRYSTECY